MPKIKKRILVGRSSDYFQDQLNDLDAIAAITGTPRAVLLRQGADHVIGLFPKELKKYKSGKK